jgi:hypothetical protein
MKYGSIQSPRPIRSQSPDGTRNTYAKYPTVRTRMTTLRVRTAGANVNRAGSGDNGDQTVS